MRWPSSLGGECKSQPRSGITLLCPANVDALNRIELATGWFGNLDSLDVAALDLLSHGPSVRYLLSYKRGVVIAPALTPDPTALSFDNLLRTQPYYGCIVAPC